MCGTERREQLVVGSLADARPRREPRVPERLAHPHVPDPGDEALSLKRLAEPRRRVVGAEIREHAIEVWRLVENVGPEPPLDARPQLEDRPVPLGGLEACAPEDDPRAAEELGVAREDAPAAVHPKVAAQDDASLEAEQEVLADRLDGVEPPPVQLFGQVLQRCARVRRLDLDALADEDLQPARRAVEGVAFRHGRARRVRGGMRRASASSIAPARRRARAALAGAAAATAWGALEPIDRRLFRCDYSDVALLGKLVTRGRGWRAAGFALHAVNGALFGIAFHEVRVRTGVEPRRLALGLALAENFALYPLSAVVDRCHPARGEEGVPPLLTNPRALGQATVRHTLFGVLLGRLA